MTIFEIIICIIVAAMFFAATFVFITCISYIKQVHRINQQVITLTNATYECRSFLEKLSKHDVITKINNINNLQKKLGELISVCKNQTNNITFVKESLDNTITNINKIGEIVADINKSSFIKYDKIVEDITYIREKFGETSVDSEKYITDIDKKLEDILSRTKRCKSGIEALIEGHNKAIDATRQSFDAINSRNDIADNAIDKTYNDVKSISKDIAKISSVLDLYWEKINYITTWIENATKLKTATKTKIAQTKTTKTPIIKK